uniref:Uncharacterized protein n=1 Tax=Oryza sativa subsp. japonica TaxID=39947 RepID=Q339P7_ORYSJ|nr:hypothetical protein LOC_Os10g19910 [Oryza sativa Japonica Group]
MANRFPPCLFPLPISSPLRSLLSPLILSHPGTDVHLLKVAHDGIGQRHMRKEEAATHGGGCVDLLHCAMHEEGGGSGFPIRAHTFPKFSLRMKLIMKDLSVISHAFYVKLILNECSCVHMLGQGLQTKCLIAGWDKASKQNFYGCWHMRHRRLRFVLRRSNWSSNI